MSDKFKFLMNNKIVTFDDAKKASILVVDGEEVHLFLSEADFNSWAKKSEYAEKLAQIDELVTRSKKYENADNTTAIKKQQEVVQRISNDLEDLAKQTGLSVNSEKLFHRAALDYHPLEGSVFDPAVLYQNINLGGAFRPLAGGGRSYPDFRWLGFNDIASSIRLWGRCRLWADVWFSGRSILLTSPPTTPVGINLTFFGFNDVASSAVVF